MLTLIKELGSKCFSGYYRKVGLFKCDCGNEKELPISNVTTGKVKSCGCLLIQKRVEFKTTHGLAYHPLYRLWDGVKRRCFRISNKDYVRYGGRGIVMCNEWKDNFKSFYDWCVANGWEKGLQIDRIDNDGNYEPNNCRFVTPKINMNNRSNNHYIKINNETKTLKQWSDLYNVATTTIWDRLKRGWNEKDAVMKPSDKRHAYKISKPTVQRQFIV